MNRQMYGNTWSDFVVTQIFPLWCFSVLFVQMTTQEVRLCGLLLREHFGEVVEKLGTHLLRNGSQNLRAILHETGMPLDLVGLTQSLHSHRLWHLPVLCFRQGSEQREANKMNCKGFSYVLYIQTNSILSFFHTAPIFVLEKCSY